LGIKRDLGRHLCVPLRRALSFLGPGELRALHVGDVKGLEVIVSALDGHVNTSASVGDVLSPNSLCVDRRSSIHEVKKASAIIERYAATLTHLKLPLLRQCDSSDRALGRCTKLESLSCASRYDPSVWLSLSQLHTLRDVDLSAVPASAIATALPKLHTLEAVVGIEGFDASPTTVKGFFELLVPRLRVLSFATFAPVWSEEEYAPSDEPPPALPLLRDLSWHDRDAPVELARRFMGARPLELDMSHAAIADWLAAVKMTGAGREGPCAQLSGVRGLNIRGALSSSEIARVLRVAPQLRRFVTYSNGIPFWLVDTSGRALSGSTHPRLRIIEVRQYADSDTDEWDEDDAQLLPPIDCALRLRRSHFPRLQYLIFYDQHNKAHRYDAMLQE
jgi:hypothetical protein